MNLPAPGRQDKADEKDTSSIYLFFKGLFALAAREQ